MRAMILSLALVSIAAITGAQPYPGDIYTVTTRGELWRLDRSGNTTLLSAQAAFSDGIAMSADNQGVLWTDYGQVTTLGSGSINEWRNNANTSLFTASAFRIEEVAVNQNGEIVFTGLDVSQTPNVSGLFKWTGGTTVSTIVTTLLLGQGSLVLDGGLDINVDTGNYLLPTGAGIAPSQIWDVEENGQFTALITATPFPPIGRYTVAQDRATGGVYQSGTTNFHLIAGGTTTSINPVGTERISYQAIRVDRSSVPDANRLLYSVFQSTSTLTNFVHTVSDLGGSPTYTSTALSGAGTIGQTTGLVFFGERNVMTKKTGPGAYDLDFSFAGEAGSPYAVGISAAGYKPPVQVNGLDIALVVDGLTVLSVQNLLRPFFDPGPGLLDANGRARGKISLGKDNLGIRIWIVALTIRAGQVRTVTAPYVLRL